MSKTTFFDQVSDSSPSSYPIPSGIELLLRKKSQILHLCAEHQVEEFYVFGSSLDSSFNSSSDFDFLVKFKKIPFDQYTDHYFLLHEKLEEILNRKIDLVTVNSLENKFFKEKVIQTRKLLYAA